MMALTQSMHECDKTLSCHALLFLLSECGEDSRMLWSFHLEFLLFGRRSLHRDLMFRHSDSDDGGDSEVNWWVGFGRFYMSFLRMFENRCLLMLGDSLVMKSQKKPKND